MPGIIDNNLVYPILDLIHREMRKFQNSEEDLGVPTVTLYRDDPHDPDRVTGASLYYESGHTMEISLSFGTDDDSALPEGVTPGHPEYEYYKYHRLSKVSVTMLNPDGVEIDSYVISLNYDNRGLLVNTDLLRV